MRNAVVAGFATLLVVALNSSAADTQPRPEHLEHPGEIALHEASPGVWRYRTFPALMPIYVYDLDSAGKSACNRGCSSAWPPVRAREEAEAVGDWSVIVRDDKVRQWAYKGRPTYVRYHDQVGAPQGDGEEGKWHLLQP